tara:strand:+ start:1034 stop:2239 length:1206 start_codon:yes stop_codon:yes gene_type:complete
MKNNLINESINNLNSYCSINNYKGYSLYDSHTSPIPFHLLGHKVSFLINQVVKRSPINSRKLIGVKKTYNPKGMGLFLYSYVLQQKLNNPFNIKDIDKKNKFFLDWLRNNSSQNQGYSGFCWGYHYPWPKSDGLLVPTGTPNSVVTAFNIRAIFDYYILSQDDSCLDLIEGAVKFILNDIPRTENQHGICFAYTPVKKDMTINASLLAAEILAYSDYVGNKREYIDMIKQVLKFTMSHQNSDGSWYYSFDPKTGRPKKQIDFHQGYVLETIKRICDFSDIDIKKYDTQIKSGLEFYRKNQFSDEGVSFWRLPKKWPVDIHNQSQGIITFSIFKDYDSSYLDFSKKIADWTINNMQDKKGNFYYQKWPFFTNKISYMRWNQGWMLLALLILKSNIEENENIY